MSNYFPDEHERLHLERRMRADVAERFDRLQQQIDALNAITLEGQDYNAPPNYLPNSHPEWSKAAYTAVPTVTATTAGDDNRECYNWYRQPSTALVLGVAIGSVTLTGGGSGSVNSITVNGVTITGGVVNFDTNLATTAANVATSINGFSSTPDYTAVAVNTTVYIYPAAGASADGFAVVANTTTITTSTVVMSTSALKREMSSFAGPPAEHTRWSVNEGANDNIPVWDGVNGTIQMGGDGTLWDIACPMNVDIVSPGQIYFVTMELQTTGSKSATMQLYCGFWDNVAGTWITGGTFTPSISVYGTEGSRTLEYRVYAETDSGEQLLSAAVDTAGVGPDTLSPENHVRLSFSGAPGFTRYDIYRKDGSNYYRVGSIRNSIDLQFYDTVESGATVVPVTGYPSVTADAPTAYAISNEFDPNDSSSFTVHTFRIRVPTTYDRSSVTAGSQWFRFGVDELTSPRSIVVRRIGVSEGYGGWTRCPRDLTATNAPTSTAASSPSPGYPVPTPPDRGTGGVSCVTLDTEIETLNPLYETIIRPISQVAKGMYLSCGPMSLPVLGVKEGEVASILHIKTGKGLELKCSHSHRLIRSNMDKTGTPAANISEGDKVLVCIDGKFEQDVVESVVEIVGTCTVKSVRLPSPHLFLTNGFVSHNAKSELPPIV